ncbi:MAG: nitronate monooxygenase [Phycisphaeraceae bacterium]|nr:MAG: nitronate monooxygenase [Phycisphaeraceae bacterium]
MLPRLIQGGMGAGVSGWPLAREVASHGQLGVVSGTALDTILVRRLGRGDPGGSLRRAMAAFPAQGIVRDTLEQFFRRDDAENEAPTADGDAPRHRYRQLPLLRAKMKPAREWLLILANFVEVFLAKEGHGGVVGINYLHKIQFPTLPSLYGAMLAGVDVVIMGAGIPGDIPAVLDRLARHERVEIALDVQDAHDERYPLSFDPASLWSAETPVLDRPLRRPQFLAIVSSTTLARALLKKAPGGIDGFVVEAPIAGGHNAPPRGVQQLSIDGEPIYGPRDEVDLAQMAALGVPFWVAGGHASQEKFSAALAAGARGVQVGTVFAFCEESGLDPELRRRYLAGVLRGEGGVFTDPAASPTSFPFKVAALSETLSDAAVYEERPRLCDLGYLRRAYRKPDGTLGYLCPAEPVEDYVRKGGKVEDTVGRKCLCNALVANIGLGQRRADGYREPPLLTAGDDIDCVRPFISAGRLSYHARDVIEAIAPRT